SMVATTFAADTPLAVTGLIAKNGLAGNWFWWAWAFGGMLTVFVFARLWRRAEVLTDVELIELRYGGKAAGFLRGFRAVYVAVVVNSIVIGWVTKAMCSVLQQTVLIDMPEGDHTDLLLVAVLLAVTGCYAIVAGMWGVAVTDMVQFVLAMFGCTVLAVVAVDHIGGVDILRDKVNSAFAGQGDPFAFVPDFRDAGAAIPMGLFVCLVLSQWWATWYPGAEPGGGGYIVQRMASCRDERHAVKATLMFQLAHYCLRPWPWILVAFVAIALHPDLRTADDAGPGFPMMIRELAPAGLAGLLLVTFAAAFMSTISTQMNWGASYLVNDVYRRFVAPDADDRQLMTASRLASAAVLLMGGAVAWFMVAEGVSVDDAWAFLAALGSGVGAVFILRWFWWRINVWSEISAMVGSVLIFALFKVLVPEDDLRGEYRSLIVASCTLVLWLAATLMTQPESRDHLIAFYRKVRPDGPGWGPVADAAPEVRPDGMLIRSILCAVFGTATIWLTLPAIGAVIFGETLKAVLCFGGAIVAGSLMFLLAGKALSSSPASAAAE
ncbi:MAG: Na+:solute symporter, partial [Planctomycetes bacterium]|nr:Na+:solute symporter [Planctomycetota bacterium]